MHIVWGYNGVAEKLSDLFAITQIFIETISKSKEIKDIPNMVNFWKIFIYMFKIFYIIDRMIILEKN